MKPEEVKRVLRAAENYLDELERSSPLFKAIESFKPRRPQYYYRDGKPILDDELLPAFMKWAMLFEHQSRTIKQTITPYGEKLSTIFLGMDHNFMSVGPPLIFETMLFAPREVKHPLLRADQDTMEAYKAESAIIEKLYPHDQLQLRYSREEDAREKHDILRAQCLIPPRWRKFLFYTIGQDETWN